MTETDITERKSGDYGDLSVEPIDPDHLYEYVMSHHHDERLAKLATGVNLARQSSSNLGELSAENNLSKLREDYDVTYSELLDGARDWKPSLTPQRALDEIDGSTSTVAQKSAEEWRQRRENEETDTETETDTAGEFVDRLDSYCEERDVSYGELLIMTQDDYNQLKRIEGREVDPQDVEAVEAERERLVGMVGIDRDDAESLSLDSLRKIAQKDPGGTDTRPAPRSGDVLDDDDELAQYSDRDRARELRARIEHLETHAGDSNELARRQVEMYRSELEDMA